MTVTKSKTEDLKDGSRENRYLTDIKELPSYSEDFIEISSKPKVLKLVVEEKSQVNNTLPLSKEEITKPLVNVNTLLGIQKQKESRGVKEQMENAKVLKVKDILLIVINLISVTLLIILLSKLPKKGEELKRLRNDVLLVNSQIPSGQAEIENNKDKAQKLEDLFIDEAGLVSFVNDIEGLKSESSSIYKVSIVGQKAVKDRTGNFGIPVIIEMKGDWKTLGEDMLRIQKLPYLVRTVRIESEPLKEEKGFDFKYGIILYTKDELGKN